MAKKGFTGGIAGMLGEPRSGYSGGGTGYKDYWTMVQESFSNAGGQDGTGMNIQDFAEMYFPRKAQGGRIGFNGGGTTLQKLKQQIIEDMRARIHDLTNTQAELIVKDITLDMGPQEASKSAMKNYLKFSSYAEGGRIGLAEGMTPSESWMRDYFYDGKGGYDDSGMTWDFFKKNIGPDLWYKHIGKAKGGRIGYDNGGPVTQEEYDAYVAEKEGAGEEPMDFETYKIFKIEFPGLAQGGRIGFKDGEGIMSRTGDMVDIRNVPYYAGKGLQGLVNSAETLSKFPLAAGELGSKLLQQKPKKEMFTEAIENITPGSWSENLGLTSLVEGMGEKRPKDAQTVGGILGLGTEIAVPTGGAFKAGQLLLSKASKAMGKVKDGKTLNKLVDQKLTDAGQSRRDFNLMAATSGLMVALKSIGLGGILKGATKVKPSDDVVMRLKTFIDDSDVDTEWGPQATAKFGGMFDVEGLSIAAKKTLDKIMKELKVARSGSDDLENTLRNNPESDFYEEIGLDWGTYILDGLRKAGHKVKLEHVDDVGGSGVDEVLWKFKNDPMYKGTTEGAEHHKKFSEKVKKMTEREKMEYHNSITDDWGGHYSDEVEAFFDEFYGVVKKAQGGRIGYDEGGWTQEDFDKYLEDRKKRDKENRKEDFLDDFEKWKKWKKTEGGTLDWAAEGGRIGLQTGGPPITLQRPMFNDGGLTKTIPPERGPDPQGLPSALYNGIMRPRSY